MKRTLAFATLAFVALLASTSPVVAQGQATTPGVIERGPYDLSKLRGICGFVYSKAREPTESEYRYTFDRMMAEAAGVLPADDDEVRRTRVRYLWLDNQQVFRCTADNFNLSGGNILKYSAGSMSYAYLYSALEHWQLELNYVDPVDHRTILDYVARDLQANWGNSDSSTIQQYFDVLKHAGARHCFELIDPRYCEHPDNSTFLNHRFSVDGPDRDPGQQAIAEYNERVRLAPLRPYRSL